MATHWTLEDLYRGVMKSWWVLAGTIVLFVAIALVLFNAYPRTYTSQAEHTVEPITVLSSGSTFNTVNMETERVVATSTTVLERASEALGGASVGALRASTVIEVPRGSQVLRFTVTTGSPTRSADWANALAVAYGEQRTANARTVVEQTSEQLTDSIVQLRALLDTQEVESSQYEATDEQLQALLDQQARLTATPFFSGLLVTPASAPLSSNRPSALVFVAAGIFLGALLGGIGALIVSRVRTAPALAYRRKRADTVVDAETSPHAADPFREDLRGSPGATSMAGGSRRKSEGESPRAKARKAVYGVTSPPMSDDTGAPGEAEATAIVDEESTSAAPTRT